jgi:hypothetical protein
VDPLTLLVASLVVLGVTASTWAYRIGLRRGRRESPCQEDLDRRVDLETKLGLAKEFNEQFSRTVDGLRATLASVEKERDRFRKMAESHEIKPVEPPEPKTVTRQIWKGRLFRGHPSENLKNMAKELAEFMNKEVVVKIAVRAGDLGVATGHYRALREARRGDDLGPFQFEGSARRALADFTTFLMDDDLGLVTVSKNHPGKKLWKDKDSPLSFHVDLTVTEVVTPTVPQVQLVEVAVVSEKIREVIVEKPVVVEVEKKAEAEPASLPKEEIRKVVADEIARREAEREVEGISKVHAVTTQRTTPDR